jgi:putative membrane protein
VVPRGRKTVAFVAVALVFALTWIRPLWPMEQAMHGSLAVIGMAWLLVHDRRWPLTDTAFAAICLFVAVHSLAARWLYSNVPYDAWAQAAFDWSPQLAFGWQRNHADRFIHLLFGLCIVPALAQVVRRRWRVTRMETLALVVGIVMVVGVVYEWLEWAIALLLAPEQAEAYNGQQGDIWDAHMDMLLAAIGALVAGIACLGRTEAANVR